MAKHKHFDLIAIVAVILALALCVGFCFGESLGLRSASRTVGYESRLFDTAKVHTIDIVIDDWEGFLSTAQSEEYTLCDVVIDGETVSGVGIRGKGNTSLSSVSAMDSERYSFKVEFDHYSNSVSYHGLDKLSLNNLIQDNTYMKDYLTYRMMAEFDATAPLCSYVYVTVNGEDWGLYLAVEGVEDSFLQRNYGRDYGELYKPDSMNMGGGRGNGRDFNMDEFMEQMEESENIAESGGDVVSSATVPAEFSGREMPQMGGEMPNMGQMPDFGGQMPSFDGQMPDFSGGTSDSATERPAMGDMGNFGGFNMFGGFGGGATLQYVDDDPDSYSTVFDSAKTDVTDGDKTRLIAALKSLSEGDTSALDTEALLRYFVVHNFVVNSDSYTGAMVHNYYLYEKDGQLSMIPWDYNLAYGTFQSGSAASSVNDDIDAPLSIRGDGSRPMADWIFQSEEATALYHEYFAQFLDTVDITALIDEAYTLIAPYVENDPTAFCTYDEFEAGVDTLRQFCTLRTESIRRQLAGDETAVDTGDLDLSLMGTMGGGFGGGPDMGQMPDFGGSDGDGSTMPSLGDETATVLPNTEQMPDMGQMPDMSTMPDFSGEMPSFDGQMPDMSTMPDMGQMPNFNGKMPNMTPPA